MQKGNLMLIRGDDREWMDEAFRNGLLSAEADRRAIKIMKEDEAIRRENAVLKGIIREQRRTIRSFQQADLEAKRYMFDRREGNRMGRGFRLIVGVSCAAMGIAMITTIYSMLAIWLM